MKTNLNNNLLSLMTLLMSLGSSAWGLDSFPQEVSRLWQSSVAGIVGSSKKITAETALTRAKLQRPRVAAEMEAFEGSIVGKADAMPVDLIAFEGRVTGKANAMPVSLTLFQGHMTGKANAMPVDLMISQGRVIGRANAMSVELVVSQGRVTGKANAMPVDLTIFHDRIIGKADAMPVELALSGVADMPLRDETLAALLAAILGD